jgi:putative restriction endonuclease
MSGASKGDRILCDEFHRNADALAPESEQLLHDLITTNEDEEVDLLRPEGIRLETSAPLPIPEGRTEGRALVKIRRGQQFFRQSILRAYGVRCCVSDIAVPELLVASHIKPWKDFPAQRLDPTNGLCLSSLHDRAFDKGLVTLDEKRTLLLSKRLRSCFPHKTLEESFVPFEGKRIRSPEQLAEPSAEYLKYHREKIFRQ